MSTGSVPTNSVPTNSVPTNSVPSESTREIIENRVKFVAKSCGNQELLHINNAFSEICHSVSCGDCILLIDGVCLYSPILSEISDRKQHNIAEQLAGEYSVDDILDALYIKVKGE